MNTTRVSTLQPVIYDGTHHEPGEEFDVDDAKLHGMVERGLVDPIGDPATILRKRKAAAAAAKKAADDAQAEVDRLEADAQSALDAKGPTPVASDAKSGKHTK